MNSQAYFGALRIKHLVDGLGHVASCRSARLEVTSDVAVSCVQRENRGAIGSPGRIGWGQRGSPSLAVVALPNSEARPVLGTTEGLLTTTTTKE
jgi:hypothetical protein